MCCTKLNFQKVKERLSNSFCGTLGTAVDDDYVENNVEVIFQIKFKFVLNLNFKLV